MKRPPIKRDGQGVGPRRLAGQVLDVAGAAAMIGCSEKLVRARASRGLLPHRRWGGRVVFLSAELGAFLKQLPGITSAQALENITARGGHDGA